MDRFIIEDGLDYLIETTEQLQKYLKTNPHKEYNLVSVYYKYGNFNLIWELMPEHKIPFVDPKLCLDNKENYA